MFAQAVSGAESIYGVSATSMNAKSESGSAGVVVYNWAVVKRVIVQVINASVLL